LSRELLTKIKSSKLLLSLARISNARVKTAFRDRAGYEEGEGEEEGNRR